MSSNSYLENQDYLEACKIAKNYTNDYPYPEGFNTTFPTSASDKVQTSQNNTIIALLIRLHQTLDKLQNKLRQISDKPTHEIDITNLTEQFSKINLGTEKKKKKPITGNFVSYNVSYKN